MPEFPTCAETLAKEIDIPLENWPLNCHAIATAVLDLVPVNGMRLARGHWTGHVDRQSQYRRSGMQQHSWLVAQDGRIVDPTRWAMENPNSPSIYIGDNDNYDEAGLEITARIPPLFPQSGPTPQAKMLAKAKPDQIDRVALALGRSTPENKDASSTDIENIASSLKYALSSPPDHLDDAAELYAALDDAGMKALIKLDLWNMVMEPQKITRSGDANRWFTLPDHDKPTPLEMFFDLCTTFISIEERELHLEDELEEIGYTLQQWHDALNEIEFFVKDTAPKYSYGFSDTPVRWLDPLVVVSSFILGKGYGVEIRVERYARSKGYNRKELDKLLQEAGDRVGYDNRWI